MIIDSLRQDLKFGARVLFKDRGFCVIATLVLALGICGVTTQLTIVDSLLFRVLPFAEADRLMAVSLRTASGVGPAVRPDSVGYFRIGDFNDVAREQTSFAELGGYLPSTFTVTIDGVSAIYAATAVSHNFFRLLGVTPQLGRDFMAEDDYRGATGTVIISAALWEEAFARDPNIINRTIKIGEESRTIVGVMPAGFRFPRSEYLWIPLQTVPYSVNLAPTARILFRSIGAIGRLDPGSTPQNARAEITAIAQRLATAYPATNQNFTLVEVEPLKTAFLGEPFRRSLYAMLASVAVLLVIASVNVMNLQLARAMRRIPEMTVRSALGATRARLAQQFLTESALVVLIGVTAGVALSFWSSHLLRGLVTSNTRGSSAAPPWAQIEMNLTVLALTIGIIAVVVLLSGLLPALLASRANAASAMKKSGRGVSGGLFNHLTRALVVAQIALMGPLLFGSTLMMRSLNNQQNFDWGFDTAPLMTNRVSLRGSRYPAGRERLAFQQNLLRAVGEDPLFTHVALTTRAPNLYAAPTDMSISYEVEGETIPAGSEPPALLREFITPGFFAALGVSPTSGRECEPDDCEPGRYNVVVNSAFATRHFGTDDPVGKRFRYIAQNNNPASQWFTIVGVVPDIAQTGPLAARVPNSACAFIPIAPQTWIPPEVTIVARGRAAPESLRSALAAHVTQIDPELSLYVPASTPRGNLLLELRERLRLTMIFCAFGLSSVMLATIGLYGVTAFSVSQRTQEFGIRAALGADRARIMGIVLREGMILSLIGGAIGVGAILVTGTITYSQVVGFLYHVGPFDPLLYAVVAGMLTAVTVVACAVPARRAARVDPMVALRSE